ncbi:MAG TPA: glycosyltransferase family 39 protein [Candidatus Binatia bacterium]|nr:glycosyltransferase family 39 protein [Candidatus Binatia bacterium]
MLARLRPDFSWRPTRTLVVYSSVWVAVAILFLWSLGTQPAGLSPAELVTKQTSNLTALGNNVFYAPWRLMQDLFLHINPHSSFLMRLPSVIFGLSFLAVFYWLLAGWLGKPIAILSTALLGVTPLYLLLSRDGTPRVLNMSLLALVGGYVWITRSKGSARAWIGFGLAIVLCLYVPGLIWFLLIGAAMKRRSIAAALRNGTARPGSIFLACLLILLLPIVITLVREPRLVRAYLLIPTHFGEPLQQLKNFGWMIWSLFIQTGQHETLILGRLPILDAAQIGLMVFGGYVMWTRLKSPLYWLIGTVLLSCLLAGLNNNFYLLAISLPFLAILVAMGLRYLFIEWVHIFPRNPLPRYFAITLMAAVVLIHVFYGVRYGLAAWPHSLAVNHLYVLK